MAKKSKAFAKEFEGVKVEGIEEYLREYARIHAIDTDGAATVEALATIVDEANKDGDFHCLKCGTKTRDVDVFCPFCGADVTEDDTGGWAAYEAKAAESDAEEACTEVDDGQHAGVGIPEADVKSVEIVATESEEIPDGEKVEDDGRSLNERVNKVLELELNVRKAGGEGAWDMGIELYAIHSTRRYTEGGFESFKEFVEAEQKKGGLGMSMGSASNFIRIARTHTRELAGQLGVDKAARLASAPEPVKKKLLKVQADGLPLASHMPKREVTEKIKEAHEKQREKEAEKSGEPVAAKPGPKAKSKFEFLLNERKRTAKLKENEPTTFALDESVAVEVSIKDGKVSIQFVAAE